jgi:L-cysteine desulfidase
MLPQSQREEIIALIRREVVPAIGCTEPAAVALCVAKATELLGSRPGCIKIALSANILKNAMGVGIPGTGGMIGLPIAVALGATIGKSAYGLEVLKDVSPQAVSEAKSYMESGVIDITVDNDAPSKLYIDVIVSGSKAADAKPARARAIISKAHTNFVYLADTEGVVMDNMADAGDDEAASGQDDKELDLTTVWEFATTSPLSEISFILEARNLNKAAAKAAFEEGFGHSLGYNIRTNGVKYFGDTPIAHMIAYTSAACDARMAGAPIAVMSNSGSGNQGITATMPVVSFAEDFGASEEQLIRALTLSHLTSIYIKQSLGRLSALCGCVVASTGASSGIVYLMGGKYEQVQAAVKNMIANLTGMICDGAKPSCAMKISSGVSTAMMSAMLAMNGQ